MKTLLCTWCRRELPDKAFYVSAQRTDRRGRAGHCIECVKAKRDAPSDCVDCGNPTTSRRAYRCLPCRKEHWRAIARDRQFDHETEGHWTRERIIKAIRAFRRERGRLPASDEWNRGSIGRGTTFATTSTFGLPGRQRKWPSTTTVRSVFGTWNAAIKEAGFKPRMQGRKA